jgi:hypothetical protein
MRSIKGFSQEAGGCSSIAGVRKHEFEPVTLRIYRPIQVGPNFLYFDIGFVGSPGVIGGFKMRFTSLF